MLTNPPYSFLKRNIISSMRTIEIKQLNFTKMATVLAEAFGDEVFIKNLKMEIKKDLNIE